MSQPENDIAATMARALNALIAPPSPRPDLESSLKNCLELADPKYAPSPENLAYAGRFLESLIYAIAVPLIGCSENGIEIEWVSVWLTLHADRSWTGVCIDPDFPIDVLRVTEHRLRLWLADLMFKPDRFLALDMQPVGLDRNV